MIYGMERNGTLPKMFGRVHPRLGRAASGDVVQPGGRRSSSCSSSAAGPRWPR